MSCSAMEKMVIGVVKGEPATATSWTEQFGTRTRAQTSRPRQVGGSRSEGLTTYLQSGSETYGDLSALQEVEEISMSDDSDSAVETELIAEKQYSH